MHPTPTNTGELTATDVQILREVTEAAGAVLTDPLRRRAAVSYLHQRGIDATGLPSEWLLGYAPPGWTRLVERLHGSFPDEALLAAGVARRSSRGTLIDTFRDRVMFGLRMADGTLAGFIGRDLSAHPGAPKYLNTHQHALFDKSSLLYGLHEGTCSSSARQPVVVEGPLDVLAIATRQQPDDGEELLPVVACGTAFTLTHARRVAQVAFAHESPVVVAMDSDPAGRSAALDAGERLRYAGLDVRVATLPNGSDPADYLARPDRGLDPFRAESGLSLINVHVEHAIARQGDRMQWVEADWPRCAASPTTSPPTHPTTPPATSPGSPTPSTSHPPPSLPKSPTPTTAWNPAAPPHQHRPYHDGAPSQVGRGPSEGSRPERLGPQRDCRCASYRSNSHGLRRG